jgi:tRNA(fMet)-specific endonuclease VapC
VGVVVDSSVLIDLERGGRSPRSLLQLAEDDFAISAVTASELMFGLHRATTAAQRRRREAFLNEALAILPVLPFDLAVAREHARIWAELATMGQPIGARDSMIAATALAHRDSLLTGNMSEFSRVAGLEVFTPTW